MTAFEHSFPFDPTGGYSTSALKALVPVIEEPDDFVAFWQSTYDWAMSQPLDWSMRPLEAAGNAETEVFAIDYAGLLGGNRIGGWLTRPRDGQVRRGFVYSHGYGGRAAPELTLPAAHAAAIFPCCSGLPTRSLIEGIPSLGETHVLHGITSRESYVHRFCVADIWRAASVLEAAVPESRARLDYFGRSFGGGIGALALPWESRFRAAHLTVPSFGNHPLRLQLPCSGSGESVRLYAQKHPEVRDVLAYFDACSAARHVRIPVHVAAAAFDPAVPPAGQFSVYHSLGEPKQLFAQSAGHFEYASAEAEAKALFEELRVFFAG
jgi:cephalosporin-C deacetylase